MDLIFRLVAKSKTHVPGGIFDTKGNLIYSCPSITVTEYSVQTANRLVKFHVVNPPSGTLNSFEYQELVKLKFLEAIRSEKVEEFNG